MQPLQTAYRYGEAGYARKQNRVKVRAVWLTSVNMVLIPLQPNSIEAIFGDATGLQGVGRHVRSTFLPNLLHRFRARRGRDCKEKEKADRKGSFSQPRLIRRFGLDAADSGMVADGVLRNSNLLANLVLCQTAMGIQHLRPATMASLSLVSWQQ